MIMELAALGAGLAGAGYSYYRSKNAPKIDTSNIDKYLNEASKLTQANTVEKVAEQSSKLSAQQGDVAGAAAQAQARTANMSRAASAAIGANAASQNILNGYSQNFNTVKGLNQDNISNYLNLAGRQSDVAKAKYDSDSNRYNAETAALGSVFQTAANGMAGLNVPSSTADTNDSQKAASSVTGSALDFKAGNEMQQKIANSATGGTSMLKQYNDMNLPLNFKLAKDVESKPYVHPSDKNKYMLPGMTSAVM